MQHVENDMDDLFRKAAENYPLKTSTKNWDDVAAVLSTAPVQNASGDQNKKRYAWLWLFGLPILTAVSLIIFYNKLQHSNEASAKTNTVAENTVAAIQEKQEDAKSGMIYLPSKTSITATDKEEHKQLTSQKKSQAIDFTATQKQTNVANKTKDAIKNNHTEAGKLDTAGAETNADAETFVVETKDNSTLAETTQKTASPDIKKSTLSDSVSKNTGASVRPETPVISKSKKRFYILAVAGPQANQVKGQGFTKLGFSAGILAGYQFTKRLSAEAGILYSCKHYFSDGKYFDMSKTGSSMPPDMKVLSLNGSSNIFEFPVKVKYDFIIKKKSNWFIASGFSSYLLTRESNNYLALISGAQQNLYSNYDNKRGYFSATINLSIGNEFNIGKHQSKIRIEPYLQIPLHGIGIGAMPVYSAGLHIGFTLPVKK